VLFNHGRIPNVDYRVDGKAELVRYIAGREIGEGEELLIYYGNDLWFEEKGVEWDAVGVDVVGEDEEGEEESESLHGLFKLQV
jgi:hypothetical protein